MRSPLPARAVYRAALDVLERDGYQIRARLLDEALVTLPRQGTDDKDLFPQVSVELQRRGDSTHVVISSVVVNREGRPLGMDNMEATAAMLLAEMGVAAAVDSLVDAGGNAVRDADPREQGDEFGFGRGNPVRVGGAAENGAANQRAYLDRLRAPGGQRLRYRRLGSCCHFPSRYSSQGTGALDAYEVTYEGQEAPQVIYIDLYTPPPATQRAPEGFTLEPDASGPRTS
ncbi:MAG TPA: hypothetical protein VF665_12235 [Longimicrobium sp.]|jgi:hypothetical protein|uniref:hypothetical protein n=1 Tax=Longimicrobium sp. TaxID=2029185 RepID=UPI002ED81ED1